MSDDDQEAALTVVDVGPTTGPAGGRGGAGAALPRQDSPVQPGTWWWFVNNSDDAPAGSPVLVCILRVGSNYAEVGYYSGREHYQSSEPYLHSWRVHFDNFWTDLQPAVNADRYIQAKLYETRRELQQLMGDVQRLAASLMVTPMSSIPGEAPNLQDSSALVVTTREDPKAYERALVEARDKTLPELYRRITEKHHEAAAWLMMPMLALKSELTPKTEMLDLVKDRIFTVQLYAGLVEQVVQVRDGEPAANDAPVHLMQRRAYMDEESLIDYDVGGMNFDRVEQFDAWIARPHNMKRVLPFDRCVIAFRVRRFDKEYEARTLWDFIQTISWRAADKTTYLYLRNGEQLYRLSTEVEFEEKLFPDSDMAALTTNKLWALTAGFESYDLENYKLITDREFQGLIEEYEEKFKTYKAKRRRVIREALQQWRSGKLDSKNHDRDSPKDYVHRALFWKMSHSDCPTDPRRSYRAFSPENVRYDDIAASVARDLKKHNRIIMILQGLLDRSPCFQPHPPWRIYTEDGFKMGVRYVYDSYHAMTSGAPPDFEAYRKRLNVGLTIGSVCIGQQAAWSRRSAKRKTQRYNYNDDVHPDPGPGQIARVSRTSRGRAVFTWTRKVERYQRHAWKRAEVVVQEKKLVVDTKDLLCIDNYQPGDYKQFFLDPRTRADYMKWAPLLLMAEEYKAGVRTLESRGARRREKLQEVSDAEDADDAEVK